MFMPTPRVMGTTDLPINNTLPASTPPNTTHLTEMGFQTPTLSSVSSKIQTRGGKRKINVGNQDSTRGRYKISRKKKDGAKLDKN